MEVHLAVIHVCVILQQVGCEPEVHRRQFGAFQRDRGAMAEWIAGFAPDTGVMESTGSDFQSPYAALERVGIRARVVNAQHVKKVPGRESSGGNLGAPIRPTALAEPDLEGYTIRLPA